MLKKKEIIWREILHHAIEKKKTDFTQKELAQKFGFSLSTVFHALKVLRQSGIITAGGRGFRVQDAEKFLYLWATFRNVKHDIIHETHVPKSAREIEGEMVSQGIFGAFSAYTKQYGEAPADYDKVYVYLKKEDLGKAEERFPRVSPSTSPRVKGYVNFVVLQADPWLHSFGSITPPAQTFVDLWNLPEWYAKDFLNALKEKFSL